MAGETYHDITQTTSSIAVPLTGYKWFKKPDNVYDMDIGKPCDEKPPFLIPIPGANDGSEIYPQQRYFDPISEKPSLFLEFVNVEPTKDGFLAFANKYGCVTDNISILTDKNDGYLVKACSLNKWKQEQSELNEILQLWYAILHSRNGTSAPIRTTNAEKTYSLRDLILVYKYQDDLFRYEFQCKNLIFKKSASVHSEQHAGLLRPAESILSKCINRKLEFSKISPQLMQDENRNFIPYLVPADLSSAMWYQLYLWISGDKSFKRCPVCGFWEDTTGLRADWKEHRECGARRRAKESYERRKTAEAGK